MRFDYYKSVILENSIDQTYINFVQNLIVNYFLKFIYPYYFISKNHINVSVFIIMVFPNFNKFTL